MSTACVAEQNLCDIVRGSTVPFFFEFIQPDGSPMNISGMMLHYSMRLDKSKTAFDFQKAVTFPADAASKNGKGSMELTPYDTGTLDQNSKYYYDFQLTDGPTIVYPMGSGEVNVPTDLAKISP